jgi:hypothetical protein
MRQNLFDSDLNDCTLRGTTKFDYEERSGAGAISLDVYCSYWTSTGASQALTLADGAEGQEKRIVHAVDGGSLVITPANFAGSAPTSATITLATAGDTVTLQFIKGQWWVVGFWSQAAITGSTITIA